MPASARSADISQFNIVPSPGKPATDFPPGRLAAGLPWVPRNAKLCFCSPCPALAGTHRIKDLSGAIPLSHDQLWAPWRLGYIQGTNSPPANVERPLHWLPGADLGCFFCRAVADGNDRENLVVARGEHSIVLLNRYPYNNGHLLVAPRGHQATLGDVLAAGHLEMMQTINRMVELLKREIKADGFNIGLNLGRVAGAGVPGHLHWHVVPRWHGDTNFMPVVADVSVIPQSLDALLMLLQSAITGEEK
jgi:ATP adenylyltransferase